MTPVRLPVYEHRTKGLASLFRFVERSDYADELASGIVWISTLARCRQYEESARGDPGEAIHRRYPGDASGGLGDPDMARLAKLFRISLHPESTGTIKGGALETSLSDAFVLCTTETRTCATSEFGTCCVEIADPSRFCKAVTLALAGMHPLTRFDWGRVTYSERTVYGDDLVQGAVGFVKPDKYAAQQEVRMLWRVPDVRDLLLTPLKVSCPEIRQYVRRLS